MSVIPNQNGNYPARKNDVIFLEGQNTQSISILTQGKLDIYISTLEKLDELSEEEIKKNSFKLFSIGQNTFIGTNDLLISKKNSFSYIAAEDSSIYAFNAHTVEQVKDLINSQKDYASNIIASISALISNSYSVFNKLERFVHTLSTLTNNLIIFYWALKEKYAFSCSPSSIFFREGLDNLEKMRDKGFAFPADFNFTFFKKDYTEIYEGENSSVGEVNVEKIEYYKHISALPWELQKSFFNSDIYISSYQCKDASNSLDEIQSKIKDAFAAANEYFRRLYMEGEECIFTEYIRATMSMQKNNSDTTSILQALDYMVYKIKETITTYESEYNYKTFIDIEHMDNVHNQAKTPIVTQYDMSTSDCTENIPDELKDSTRKILEYSNIPKERADLFRENLEAFRNLKDKLSLDNDVKNIRSEVTSVFFEIYEAVIKRVVEEKNESRLYHLFLTYGFMDEKLLDVEHTLTLYKLSDKSTSGGQRVVYSSKDWLSSIYNMEKDPSIDEFGQDYFDIFREKKKRREVSDKDKALYDNNVDERLKFEVNNMFKINQRLCHGQISVYFPILHNDMITRDLSKSLVTTDRIIEGINKLLEVDFSAFHREISYRNVEKGIEKELIMKSITPDIILMPTFGSRAIMWQELTGRNRSTPGRFLFPIFTTENLDDLLVKLVGNFRWELCRTMMGVAWNDITQKSLTSEYADYIQFIKKNRDLSEEAREKVKTQIVKYRNRTRDIFTSDYDTWVNFEAKGIIRLNKVVRSIMYRYCPLPRQQREQLENQPMYSATAIPFKNLRAKQARELENHYSKMVKSGTPLDTEFEQNLKFHKEM